MKRSRFSHQQISRILNEFESGRTVAELCQEYGVSSSTIYAWKSRYEHHAGASDLHVLNLEAENRRLKQRLDDLSLDYESLKGEMRLLRNAEPAD